MIEQDTIRLLRECDAGIKMGITSIDDVVDYVCSDRLKRSLLNSKKEHQKLQREIEKLLNDYQDEGKDPSIITTTMSWMKTKMKLIMKESDDTIADLMTEGCNMGIKSLNKYLNKYEAADEKSKDITKKLIKIEDKLSNELREYL